MFTVNELSPVAWTFVPAGIEKFLQLATSPHYANFRGKPTPGSIRRSPASITFGMANPIPESGVLSDNEIDDRLKAAIAALGDEPGQTTEGNAALTAARKALRMLSLALIASEMKRDNGEAAAIRQLWPWPL